jgi:hypothetical protein
MVLISCINVVYSWICSKFFWVTYNEVHYWHYDRGKNTSLQQSSTQVSRFCTNCSSNKFHLHIVHTILLQYEICQNSHSIFHYSMKIGKINCLSVYVADVKCQLNCISFTSVLYLHQCGRPEADNTAAVTYAGIGRKVMLTFIIPLCMMFTCEK